MASQEATKGKKADSTEEDSNKKQNGKSDENNHEDKFDIQQLDSLLSLLDGDITSIDSEEALNLVDNWYNIVHKEKDAHSKELAKHLKELSKSLKGGKATGHEIGEILSEIGEQTTEIAGDADKEFKNPLKKLGKQLNKVGTSLGKAEDREHIEHLESLVETLEGDLTQVDSDTAVSAIDEWYTLLHKSEEENLQQVANGLKHLKQILKRSNPKAADIGQALVELGEQTVECSKDAAKGFKGPIQRLGKLLAKTGKSLE
jgi:uncharacterized phage infection (PIP) family protein YhgE